MAIKIEDLEILNDPSLIQNLETNFVILGNHLIGKSSRISLAQIKQILITKYERDNLHNG